MTIWININKHVIAANNKHGDNEPPIRVSRGKHGRPVYCHQVEILGPSEIVYDAGKAILPCGARIAIKTEAEVITK